MVVFVVHPEQGDKRSWSFSAGGEAAVWSDEAGCAHGSIRVFRQHDDKFVVVVLLVGVWFLAP